MKKAFALVLSIAMLLMCMPMGAFAGDTWGGFTVEGPATAEIGKTVDFIIYLDDCSELSSDVTNIEFTIKLSDGLSFVEGVVDSELADKTGFVNPTLKGMKVSALGALGQGYTGGKIAVAKITCAVEASGEQSVDLTDAVLTDNEYNSKTPAINAAVVAVAEPACQHEWSDWEVTAATCEEDGLQTRTCGLCGETEEEVLPALGHDWEWVIDKEPTKEETGLKHEVCGNCGEIRNEGTVIDKLKDTTGVITPVGPSKDDEEEKEEIALPFTDVLESDWFYGDVVYVYENGLMNGMSATTFGPYGITTRGQIVTILYRLEGQPAVAGACPFTDVAAGSYYEAAITWAAANGIVTGYDATTFGPDDQITREQMAAILYRYAQGKGMASMDLADNLAAFTDADKISAYAVEAMNWAVGQGLINGMGDGTVAPQGQAIRAQAAAILHRFCETLQLI